MLEPRQPIGQGAHVATALDVVLATERVHAAAIAPHVAGQKNERDEREHVVDRVMVLGDAEGPDDGPGRLCERVRELADGLGRDARLVLGVLQGVRLPTLALYASKSTVARSMKLRSSRPAAMISRAMALARAMSDPTSSPSQLSAHSADEVRRGSIAYRRAPLWTALRT